MNYEFPEITHRDDIHKIVLESDGEFYYVEKDGYVVYNYLLPTNSTFPIVHRDDQREAKLRREIRGLIFDLETGELLRRPFQKFFNINEREDTQQENIDFSKPHYILEKCDGSMISPFMVKGELRWGTKMGETDVSAQIMPFLEENPNYVEFVKEHLSWGNTPIFEWCSRENRIVIDHPEPRLVLTAIRFTLTGDYVSYYGMVEEADRCGIDVVRKVFDGEVSDINSFIAYTRTLTNTEGFVVRFVDGHMVKIKSDWYVAIHKIKEQILFDRNVVLLTLDQKIDDILSFLDETDRENLYDFSSDISTRISTMINHFMHGMLHRYSKMTKKDFALGEAKTMNTLDKAAIFKFMDKWHGIEDGYDLIRDYVLETVRKHCTSNSHYDILKSTWFKGIERNA